MSWISTIKHGWLDGYRKIFCYTGRARRRDYLSFLLCHLFFMLFLIWILTRLGYLLLGDDDHIIVLIIIGILGLIGALATLSYSVRRLHDTGASGWWSLLIFVLGMLFVGALIAVAPSEKGLAYGPDPRQPS